MPYCCRTAYAARAWRFRVARSPACLPTPARAPRAYALAAHARAAAARILRCALTFLPARYFHAACARLPRARKTFYLRHGCARMPVLHDVAYTHTARGALRQRTVWRFACRALGGCSALRRAFAGCRLPSLCMLLAWRTTSCFWHFRVATPRFRCARNSAAQKRCFAHFYGSARTLCLRRLLAQRRGLRILCLAATALCILLYCCQCSAVTFSVRVAASAFAYMPVPYITYFAALPVATFITRLY